MNESIDWKSAVAFTVKDQGKGVLMRFRCVLLFAGLVFANFPATALAESSSCPGIHDPFNEYTPSNPLIGLGFFCAMIRLDS